VPYESHPLIDTPPDDTVVWRFLDFPKFVSLLETSRLVLARADRFDDPREGEFTDAELRHLDGLQHQSDAHRSGAERVTASFDKTRRQCFVNCWYGKTNVESTPMWKLYAPGAGGIAVKSSIGAIKRALGPANRPIHIGRVRYLDWTRESAWTLDVFNMLLRKHSGYEHESEVRLLIWDPDSGSPAASLRVTRIANEMADRLRPQGWDCSGNELRRICEDAVFSSVERESIALTPTTVSVEIDMESLVEELVVGPDQSNWVVDLVRQLVNCRYHLPKEVRRSGLRWEPSRSM